MVSVSPENVATPWLAVTVSVPPSVAPAGSFASATVTVPSKDDSRLPELSSASTVRPKGVPAARLAGGLLRDHQLAGDRRVAQQPECGGAELAGWIIHRGPGDIAVGPNRDAIRRAPGAVGELHPPACSKRRVERTAGQQAVHQNPTAAAADAAQGCLEQDFVVGLHSDLDSTSLGRVREVPAGAERRVECPVRVEPGDAAIPRAGIVDVAEDDLTVGLEADALDSLCVEPNGRS